MGCAQGYVGWTWGGKRRELRLEQKGTCHVWYSEESKNSKLEPGHLGHVEGVYVEIGRKDIFHLQVVNQAVKQLNTEISFVDLHYFVLLPSKCLGAGLPTNT